MKKVIDLLKQPLLFPVSILAVVYIYCFFTAPMSLFDHNFGNYIAGIILLSIYILITGLAKVASANWKWTIVLIVLGSPLIFFLAIIIWSFLESQFFGEYVLTVIFVVEMLLATSYPLITILLSKQISKNRNTSLALFIAMLPILGASFIYPIYVYPKILDEAKLGNYKYYVVISPDLDGHYFQTLYKCNQFGLGCRHLYGSYSESIGKLVVDEEKKEVSLLGFIGLLYTDGENPRTYSQPSVEFENHIYQFWDECNNFSNNKEHYSYDTYILHECNLEYKSCNPLPVQYTTQDSDIVLRIIGNEETKEINIYSDYPEDGGVLILTYSEYPRCYVEGCEILEQK